MNKDIQKRLMKIQIRAELKKLYEINIEKKKILKERREKALQNAKDRNVEKVNA